VPRPWGAALGPSAAAGALSDFRLFPAAGLRAGRHGNGGGASFE
jgi:hypothetical protein